MKKKLKNLILNLENFRPQTSKEKDEILEFILTQISFFQHERLIHFLVTSLFTLLLFGFFVLFFVSGNLGLGLITLILFVFEIFYIRHYFILENGVQKLYEIYEKILKFSVL
ncbi:MAG: hypothetical protein MR902_04630 [Campylobacter sp.]|nr:hypothetical protein [Campylobacter sp.]